MSFCMIWCRAGNLLLGFLSELLVFCEKMSEWAIRSKKRAIRSWALIFGERPERFAHGHLFLVSDLSESLMVAHFWWATWVICSRSLICLERPVHFAHSRSFVLSDLSESLTVAHLIWEKWAMSEFPALIWWHIFVVTFFYQCFYYPHLNLGWCVLNKRDRQSVSYIFSYISLYLFAYIHGKKIFNNPSFLKISP